MGCDLELVLARASNGHVQTAFKGICQLLLIVHGRIDVLKITNLRPGLGQLV